MTEKIDVMIPEEEVMKRIDELAKEIDEEYKGNTRHMIFMLKGMVVCSC